MATIRINGKHTDKGKLEIEVSKQYEDGKAVITCMGRLHTHRYIENLESVEGNRITMSDIDVIEEYLSEDEYAVSYKFTAGKWHIKEINPNITVSQMLVIEEELFDVDYDKIVKEIKEGDNNE